MTLEADSPPDLPGPGHFDRDSETYRGKDEAVGLDVWVSGRLSLSAAAEPALLNAARARLDFDPDHSLGVDELFTWEGQAERTRVGPDVVELSPPGPRGDPKWSARATRFYALLGEFVDDGHVHVGSPNGDWSFVYSEGGVAQLGISAYDGSRSIEEGLQLVEPTYDSAGNLLAKLAHLLTCTPVLKLGRLLRLR